MRWRKKFAARDFTSGDLVPNFYTPSWVRERLRILTRVKRGWKGEHELDVAYAAQDSWYNCLRATLRKVQLCAEAHSVSTYRKY